MDEFAEITAATTTGVATTGVATTGVATTGVAASGATTGLVTIGADATVGKMGNPLRRNDFCGAVVAEATAGWAGRRYGATAMPYGSTAIP